MYYDIKRVHKPIALTCKAGYQVQGLSCVKPSTYVVNAHCAAGTLSLDKKHCVIEHTHATKFDYPIYAYEQGDEDIALSAATSAKGDAVLSLAIEGTQSQLYFSKNQFTVFGLEDLQKSANVKVDWDGYLKQIKVDQADQRVFYYFQTAPLDLRPTPAIPLLQDQDWTKNQLLTHIGMCVENKKSYQVKCRDPIQLEYQKAQKETVDLYLVKTQSKHANSSSRTIPIQALHMLIL